MNSGKTQCHKCSKLYSLPREYSTHLKKVHPGMKIKGTGKLKRWLFDISKLSISGSKLDPDPDKPGSLRRCSDQDPVTFEPYLDFKTPREIISQDDASSDIKSDSVRSHREARRFTSDSEPDGDGHLSDSPDLRIHAGIAIRKYT